jgi:hypothetical protein
VGQLIIACTFGDSVEEGQFGSISGNLIQGLRKTTRRSFGVGCIKDSRRQFVVSLEIVTLLVDCLRFFG